MNEFLLNTITKIETCLSASAGIEFTAHADTHSKAWRWQAEKVYGIRVPPLTSMI